MVLTKLKTLQTKLRDEADDLLRECEAVVVLTNTMTPARRRTISLKKQKLDSLTNRELRECIKWTKDIIEASRRELVIKGSASELVQLLRAVESHAGQVTYMPKFWIKKLFDNYEKVLPGFYLLPEHALIGIKPERQEGEWPEWWLLEAKLYEDMCALLNLSKHSSGGADPSRKAIKAREALYHATVNAAFFLLEAFLNGLAVDYYITHHAEIDEKTEDILAESGRRHLSIREKVLQYPRIILGVEHPPLQESNCPELAYMLDRAKLLRDSIAHASAWPNPKTGRPEKIHARFSLGVQEVERIVDTAITLIRKIEKSVRGNEKRLYWLLDREPDGLFPDRVFE